MTKTDIDTIIKTLCPNDEDFEKPIISPAYLKKELEALALEQESCEDCVSREDIKKVAKEMYLEVGNMELDVHTISDCISYTASKCRQVLVDKLNNLPRVTPKPRTGFWLVGEKHLFCVACGMTYDTDNVNEKPPYCPCCGAKMEVVSK